MSFKDIKIFEKWNNVYMCFQQQQIQTIEETKLSKKSKAGVLPFVHQFAVSMSPSYSMP